MIVHRNTRAALYFQEGNLHFEQFVRVPVAIFDRFLPRRLSGLEWRILLWTVRNTLGWDRTMAKFSWYRIAKRLSADRSGVARAGKRLVKTGVLVIQDGRVGLAMSADFCPPGTAVLGDNEHRRRRRGATLFQRAIEKGTEMNQSKRPQTESHPAGAARPVPGKYDTLSES